MRYDTKDIYFNYKAYYKDFIETDSVKYGVILGCANDLLFALDTINMTKADRDVCKILKEGYIVRNKGANDVAWYKRMPTKVSSQGVWIGGLYEQILNLSKVFPDCSFSFIQWEDEEIFSVKRYLRLYQNRERRALHDE